MQLTFIKSTNVHKMMSLYSNFVDFSGSTFWVLSFTVLASIGLLLLGNVINTSFMSINLNIGNEISSLLVKRCRLSVYVYVFLVMCFVIACTFETWALWHAIRWGPDFDCNIMQASAKYSWLWRNFDVLTYTDPRVEILLPHSALTHALNPILRFGNVTSNTTN